MAVAIPLRSGVSSRSEGALTAALYKDHAGELLRFAWHRLGRLEDAEDAVQATFLSAHRVLAEGERVREPRAWLFRILRNECLTRIAMTKRRGVNEELGEWHADPRASVAEQMESNDEFDVAVALLATLPEQQREAMVLREWLGMSAIETADVLNVTPQGVDALVYRARKSLVGLAEVEEESTCADVRQALADGKVSSRTRAHLLACRSCRTAARRLHAPEELAVAHGMLPLDSIAARLGESIPGFAVAGGVLAVAGGGAAAAGIAGSIAAGTAVKVVATVAIGAVVATGVVREAPAIRNALAPASNVQEVQSAPPAKPPASADGTKRITDRQPEVGAGASGGVGSAAAAVAVGLPVVAAPPAGGAAAPLVAVPPTEGSGGASAGAPVEDDGAETEGGAAPAAGSKAPTTPAPAAPGKPATPGKAETDKGDGQKDAPSKPEAPKSEAPKSEKPKSESPKSESPKSDNPKSESPKSENPKSEAPKSENPKSENPKSENPKSENPKSENPKSETPKSESPKSEKPKAETPKSENPKSESPKSENPKSENPKSDPPKPATPVVIAEPAQQAPAAEPAKPGKDRDPGKGRDK